MEKSTRCRIANTDLAILAGDITQQDTDAIVNAANSRLRGGGGVDGAIHRAAGPIIDRQCRVYIREHGSLPPGRAMWTDSGNLKAKYVIHTVGPIYRNDEESEPILRSAYQESLRLADDLGARSISFPAISAGVYGYPLDKAARVALTAITDYLREGDTSLVLVQMVCFTDSSYAAFHRALKGCEAVMGDE
ncbi:O-acetyl-ADP-ribose deacetylase [Candidatus Bipolaricaulota bacterium]|nr:O-acetyl-ADP-ribose deacetylase [Candidatus Bipolaricaulota bacterium]